jgi:hypothetical protein
MSCRVLAAHTLLIYLRTHPRLNTILAIFDVCVLNIFLSPIYRLGRGMFFLFASEKSDLGVAFQSTPSQSIGFEN